MRIKFLSVIISFFLVSFAITSCLDTENTIELSSDPTVHGFAIDDILGVNYKFTIDQFGKSIAEGGAGPDVGLIYNEDSLPVKSDTIINKILITQLAIRGYATTGVENKLFNTADSMDLTKPIKIKVWAPDGVNSKPYQIKVNVHQHDPDSMHWVKMSDSFSGNDFFGYQKIVVLKKNLIIYTSNKQAYTSLTSNGNSWQSLSVRGLPADVKLQSILNYDNMLYAIDANGAVYESGDGAQWEVSASLPTDKKITALIASFQPNNGNNVAGIAAIMENEGTPTFCMSNAITTSWSIGDVVPDNFPTDRIVPTVYSSSTGVLTAVIMGNSDADSKITLPWASQSGISWTPFTTYEDNSCPKLNNPSIFHYNNLFYAMGGNFKTFYSSIAGLVWEKADKKFFLPEKFYGRKDYSMVVDENNFIWVVWSNGVRDAMDDDERPIDPEHYTNEVWRGRLNLLGFDRR